MTGFCLFAYNDEISGLGTLILLQAPAWPFLGKRELHNRIPKRELGNEQTIPPSPPLQKGAGGIFMENN